jgi:hypothetical protein
MQSLRYFLEFVLERLVAHPDDVDIREVEEEGHKTFVLTLNKEDIGKVIGRNGRTISAIRNLLTAAASKHDTKVSVEIQEG